MRIQGRGAPPIGPIKPLTLLKAQSTSPQSRHFRQLSLKWTAVWDKPRSLHRTDTQPGPTGAQKQGSGRNSALGARLGVRGHVGQQTRIVSAIAPIGGISHGTRARVLGAHTVFPRGRQTLVNEVAVHLRDEARDAAPSTRRRRITHWGFPDRRTQPPPRHEQRPQALCDAQRCRAPRQTGNRVA